MRLSQVQRAGFRIYCVIERRRPSRVVWMQSRPQASAIRRIFQRPCGFPVEVQPGGKMAPLRPGLTPVRRAAGLAAVLFLVICAAVFYRAASGLPSSGPSPSTTANSSASPAPTKVGSESATPTALSSSSGSGQQEAIQLKDSALSAKPFQAVPIQGTYHGGADTFLRVQRWEGGKWVDFPVPTKTDQSGRFTAYVELGRPGRYRLRVLDPDSGMRSKPFVLVIS
jgi:hypothetical protein